MMRSLLQKLDRASFSKATDRDFMLAIARLRDKEYMSTLIDDSEEPKEIRKEASVLHTAKHERETKKIQLPDLDEDVLQLEEGQF